MININEHAIENVASELRMALKTATNQAGLLISQPSDEDTYRRATLIALQVIALESYGNDALIKSDAVTYMSLEKLPQDTGK